MALGFSNFVLHVSVMKDLGKFSGNDIIGISSADWVLGIELRSAKCQSVSGHLSSLSALL